MQSGALDMTILCRDWHRDASYFSLNKIDGTDGMALLARFKT
ncbi:hypothetical protein SAMN05216559_1530 [Halomicrobium zhouii]|uniref:Uncharacterized protein n=1 Tax=Halomicrobium zhouii TaxID=767519 RepID=A0A1I6KTE0_9EURY|nr:hypothetical protein SAMN05216559_1530 [Halomicrobium zhouii]